MRTHLIHNFVTTKGIFKCILYNDYIELINYCILREKCLKTVWLIGVFSEGILSEGSRAARVNAPGGE